MPTETAPSFTKIPDSATPRRGFRKKTNAHDTWVQNGAGLVASRLGDGPGAQTATKLFSLQFAASIPGNYQRLWERFVSSVFPEVNAAIHFC